MNNSPLIHTVVNLCLIPALVIQPIAIMAARGTCAESCRSVACFKATMVCTGCNRCEVQSAGDMCGCCSGNEDEAEGCCTTKAGKPMFDELFGEISDVVPEPPTTEFELSSQEATELSSCSCGVHSQPFGPVPCRGAVPHARNIAAIVYLDPIASDVGLAVRPDRLTARLPIGDFSPRFSQRFLCIWRI